MSASDHDSSQDSSLIGSEGGLGIGDLSFSGEEDDDDFEGEKTDQEVSKYTFHDRLVWDGTTRTLLALDIVLNQVTPVNREAPITFGHVKIQLYIDIYNTRISHQYVVILL